MVGRTAIALPALLLLAGLAPAQSVLADELAHLVPLRGAAYRAARDQLLGRGQALLAELRTLAPAPAWDGNGEPPATWHRAALAAALEARLQPGGELARRMDHLRGVNPQHYQQRLVPRPEVGRELAHLGLTPDAGAAVALMMETFLHLRDLAGSGPWAAAEEQAALTEGILVGLERTADPRALPLLQQVALGEEHPMEVRSLAIRGLGALAETLVRQDPRREVEGLRRQLRAHQRAEDPRLRHAAAQGLGRIPTMGALRDLEASLADETDPEVRSTVLIATGTLVTPLVWVARGEGLAPRREELRAEAARFVTQVYVSGSQQDRPAARTAVLLVAHPLSLELLDEAVEDHRLLMEILRRRAAR